jgi:tRNA (Thr-GGU) A37 N-methylase
MLNTLKIKLRILASLAATALLAACASGPPTPVVDFKPDYNFMQVQKIAFYKDSGAVSGDNPLQLSDMQRDRINSALEQAITGKGLTWVEDASQADLLLSWHLATQNKTDVRTYETPSMGVGYGRYGGYNRYSMYSCWSCTQTEVSVQNYTQGTFIVDMIDPTLHKSVWRSVTQSRLKGNHQEDQDRYNAAAENILGSFPPP